MVLKKRPTILMMRFNCVSFLLLAGISNLFAQNLILNPGGEEAAQCPLGESYDFFYKGPGKYWTSPKTGTPDYYHKTCAFPGSATTTNNSAAHEGDAFFGFYVYGQFGNGNQKIYNREYIQGTLAKPLVKDHIYAVRFWVKPVNADIAGISAGISQTGIFFSDTLMTTGPDFLITAKPQVEFSGKPITNLQNWTQISGCFKAKGGEKYFTVGNFYPDEATEMHPLPGAVNTSLGYMLADDFLLEEIATEALIAPRDLKFCNGDSVQIPLKTGNFTGFRWDDNFTHGPRYVHKQGTYVVRADYKDVCFIHDTVSVKSVQCSNCHFVVPEAFTPDGNGINDHFEIVSDCTPKIVIMQVYSRWGEKICEIASKSPQWDGTSYGKTIPQGVYIYKIEILFEENEVLKRQILNGVVTLSR